MTVRAVFFGSPREAVSVLTALTHAGHEVAAVYTRPDAVAGRAKSPEATPVKTAALELGLPVETPASLRPGGALDRLASYRADVFVVAAYGRILPPPALQVPGLGALNIHPSLLPRHRGPSPVATAILEGDSQTGVTVMLLDEGMDTGPILARSDPVPIATDATTGRLTHTLFETGARLLIDTLPAWQRGEIRPAPQDESAATVTRLLERRDGLIDWTLPAARVERTVRAYDPWPGTHTTWRGQVLKVLEAAPGETGPAAAARAPGRVFRSGAGLGVVCGQGALILRRLQLEGRRPVTAAEFLRGHAAIEAAVLGSG